MKTFYYCFNKKGKIISGKYTDYTNFYLLHGREDLHRANNVCEGFRRVLNMWLSNKKHKFGIAVAKLEALYTEYRNKHIEIIANPDLRGKPFLFDMKVKELFTQE